MRLKLIQGAAYVAPPPVPAEVKKATRIEARKAHAAKMLAWWERHLVIARRRASSWRTKVRYYERREAQAAKVKS